MSIPFSGNPSSGAEHRLHIETELPNGPLDLTGRTFAVRVFVEPGGFATDPNNPGGVKVYIKSGDSLVYADLGFLNYEVATDDWHYLFASRPETPSYQDSGFDVTDVRIVGLEFSSGSAGTLAPAVIYFDGLEIF